MNAGLGSESPDVVAGEPTPARGGRILGDADVVDFPHVATVTGGTIFRPTRIADFGDIAFLPQVADVPEVQDAVIAVDVGGTSIKGAIVAARPDSASIVVSRTVPTPRAQGPEAVAAATVAMITGLIRDSEGVVVVKGIGLGVPGIVDEDNGVVVRSEHFGWTDVPFADMIRTGLSLPLAMGKDVRLSALAEWRWGAGRGTSDMAFVAAGLGVSCAVIVGGDAAYAGGHAGEIGHGGAVRGDPCACGGRGCLDTYGSGGAIARRFTEATGRPVDGAREVVMLAQAGDAVARDVWDGAMDGLAEAISGIVRVLGTPMVVMGGGLAAAGDALMVPLATKLRSRLTVHRMPELVPAAMGPRATLYGAALMGFREAGL
jgi:glucokinase